MGIFWDYHGTRKAILKRLFKIMYLFFQATVFLGLYGGGMWGTWSGLPEGLEVLSEVRSPPYVYSGTTILKQLFK